MVTQIFPFVFSCFKFVKDLNGNLCASCLAFKMESNSPVILYLVLDLFTQGTLLHVAVQGILTGEKTLNEDGECLENVSGYLQSISHVLEDITGVKAIESVVQHQPLRYLGIVDCVAMYK